MRVDLVLNDRYKEVLNDVDAYPFNIVDGESNEILGHIDLNYRSDLNAYQIYNSGVKNKGNGIGKAAYLLLFKKLDKPVYSDSSLTVDAENLWKSLVKSGDAVYDTTNKKFKSLDRGKRLNEQISKIRLFMGLSESVTVYRGIGDVFGGGSNEGFLWVATDKTVAMDYASYDVDNKSFNIKEYNIDAPTNVFKFPYKYNVAVKGSDIANNLRLVRDRKFKSKEISIDFYREISDMINEYVGLAGDNVEPYHTKIDKPLASKVISKILSYLGYDAIQIDTDRGITWGIIKK